MASVLLAQPAITEYGLPRGSIPVAIANGPDGNLWIVETGTNKIAKVTTEGLITEYPVPTPSAQLFGITAGPDGNIWFTEASGNSIGKITPTGAVTEYPLPTAGSYPSTITQGSDGSLWFIEDAGIGRITTGGTLTEYPFNGVAWLYSQITSGPDGNLWFTSTLTDEIGRVTPSGAITRYPLLATKPAGMGSLRPQGISAGSDGNLYVVGTQVWRVSLAGEATPLFAWSVGSITSGTDGNLWITNEITSRIIKLTASGVYTSYPVPAIASCPIAGPGGDIWFIEAGASKVARVVLSTVPPDNLLTLSQTTITFSAPAGGNPPAQTLTVTSPTSASFTVSAFSQYNSWLSVSPSGNLTTNQSLSVGASQTNVGAEYGSHFGYILLSSGSVTQTVQVTLNLSRPPVGGDVKVSPASLRFDAMIGDGMSAAKGLGISMASPGSGPLLVGISGTVSSPAGGKWLLLPATSITIPDLGESGSSIELPVRVDSTGLSEGTYAASITVAPAGGTAVVVPVRLAVTSSSGANIITIVNAASFSDVDLAIAPGEIVSIFGNGLGPVDPVGLALDSGGKVATSLGNVTVTFNGYPAPLIYVSSWQINCVVPYEIDGANEVLVQVRHSGQPGRYPMRAKATMPGIFTLDGSSAGTAASTNSTGGYNGPGNPAPAGSTITIYVTGEGQTTPRGVTGKVTEVDTLSGGPLTPQPLIQPTVSIAGVPATVIFYGEAPGMVAGIMQLNVQIPAGLSRASVPLIVSFGSASTQSGVTVWVQ